MSIPLEFQSLLTAGVTDLLVTGPNSAQVDRGRGLESLSVDFGSEENLRRIAIELALQSGSRVDISKPIADFSVGGLRCQVVLPFGVSNHTILSFRRHPGVQVTLEHLLEAKMLTEAQAEHLQQSLLSHKTILISGPTGSGKTTLLGALIHASGQRVICIEQTPELNPQFPSVGLFEREANQEGVGLIDSTDLLVHALRMRPDRIALGEVRGKEFGALLLAINNGHSALATLHAENLDALPRRLQILGQLAEMNGPLVHELVFGAIDLVVQLDPGLPRKVAGFATFEFSGQKLRAVPFDL